MHDKTAAEPNQAGELNQQLLQLIQGTVVTQTIYVVAKLGIADQLAGGPKTAGELADAVACDAGALYRVLRFVTGIGLFRESEGRRFEITPLGERLRSDIEGSLRGWASVRGEEWLSRPWGEILHSVKTGEPAFDHVFGMNAFEYFGKNPEAARIFDAAMRSITGQTAGAILDAYDFSVFGTIMDVAGGDGGLLLEILRKHPEIRGVLTDMEHVIEGGRKAVADAGMAQRCRCEPCDFFDEIPSGADACIFKHILHDWDDERSIAILKNCCKAIADTGKLLVIEAVIRTDNQPDLGKMTDIEMLVMTPGGRERTEEEYGALFEAAGFRLTRVIPTAHYESIIEGRPA